MKVFSFALSLLSILGLSACSVVETSSISKGGRANRTLVIELFAARGFLGGTDYEQYKFGEGLLWRECGAVAAKGPAAAQKGTQPGDVVFTPDPSLQPQERFVDDVETSDQLAIEQAARRLIKAKTSGEQLKDPLPGSLFALSEPGLFELTVELDGRKAHFVTSVDAVADGENETLEEARSLFSLVRGVGPVMCASPTFFGVRRSDPSAN